MSMDAMPIWMIFAATMAIILLASEAGCRMGHAARRRTADEKESSVGAIVGSILGLTAFLLAFTFGLVTDRYDARKALVRDEANSIGTTFLRADFLPEPDRAVAKSLLRNYVDVRVSAAKSRDFQRVNQAMAETTRIQKQLWDMAVKNARLDMNSDVAALYIDSLNQMIDLHGLRVVIGLQSRIPSGIWWVLWGLVILGLIGVGYQTAIAGSHRSRMMPILALAFSLVIALIASLDRPQSPLAAVSQQPLENARAAMGENGHGPSGQRVLP